jgi:hypothetical protein
MKKAIILTMLLLLVTPSIHAMRPVSSDPPCEWQWVGWWWGIATYADWSEASVGGDRLRNDCTGQTKLTFDPRNVHVWCPNGPEAPCIARDHWPLGVIEYP